MPGTSDPFHAFVRFAAREGDPVADAEFQESMFRETMAKYDVDVLKFYVTEGRGEAELLARGDDPESDLWAGFVRFTKSADRAERGVKWQYEWQAVSLGPKL